MLIKVENLSKCYPSSTNNVVENICFSLERGETLGIFGDSGSGKSTIAQILAGILHPSTGRVYYEDSLLHYPLKGEQRRRIQILFQHPETSFDPRMTLWNSMKEPYRFCSRPYSEKKLLEHLYPYGIYRELLSRYPSELSGGELQRLALARIMLAMPNVVILDEPTSMLDVISQAQVIQLLQTLQHEQGISYLFISHDWELCLKFCDRVLVLENGNFVKETHCDHTMFG